MYYETFHEDTHERHQLIKEWILENGLGSANGFNACISSRCTLQCGSCLRQSLAAQGKHPGFSGGDLTLDDTKKLFKYFREVQINGQVSDPIFNPHLEEILKYMHESKDADMTWSNLHTAATAKKYKKPYYKKLFEANPDILWIFGIDGLPEESHLYRKNQDGKFLFEMMCMATDMGVRTTWQWIVFNYNENHIEQGKELAKKHNLDLEITHSSRWDGLEDLKPSNPEYTKEYGSG